MKLISLLILALAIAGCANRYPDNNCYSYKQCPERLHSIVPSADVIEQYKTLGAPLPIKFTPPLHPKYALKNSVEGWVRLSFDITPEGLATNIKVLEASPEGIFENSSIEALSHSIFEKSDKGFKGKTQMHAYRIY